MMRRLVALLLCVSPLAMPQSSAQEYESVFENDVVAVYKIDLTPKKSISTVESAHDSFWLSLSQATLTFSTQRGSSEIEFQPGDTRFFPSFDIKVITNTGSSNFRGVLVALKPRALISSGCECTGNTGKTVCGCKGAGHLESLWAFNMGAVTLAGTELAPDEQFRAAAERDDMLLVAITDLHLKDEAENPASLDKPENLATFLKSGEAAWISGGRHRFKNIGNKAARFVTFEF